MSTEVAVGIIGFIGAVIGSAVGVAGTVYATYRQERAQQSQAVLDAHRGFLEYCATFLDAWTERLLVEPTPSQEVFRRVRESLIRARFRLTTIERNEVSRRLAMGVHATISDALAFTTEELLPLPRERRAAHVVAVRQEFERAQHELVQNLRDRFGVDL